MRKILSFAAIAAFLLGCSSCNKQAVPEQGEGTVIKTVSVDLGGSTRTRAASALAGEATINDATLFVWQHNGVSEPVLYAKTYAEATVFNFDLMFSDQTEYTYTINAWANMGELAAEPADGEVLFSNESADGVQMKGSKTGITQAIAESVTIDMQRYVGKITVSEVAVEWTNEQNALQEFTLKSMYIANAGDKAEGAVATYNVGGTYSASAMDAMLYSPVSSVIADGAKYSTPQMMYAYGSGTTELVLECELGGQTMYYHVPYEPEANTHRAFKLTIRQAGADEPLGELPEEAIVANVTTLNVLGFDEDEESVDFGDKPIVAGSSSLQSYEPMIVHVNGSYYTGEQWEEYSLDDEDAVGIAVSDGVHGIVIYPGQELTEERNSLLYSESENLEGISGVSCYDSHLGVDYALKNDFNGESNTEALLSATTEGVIESAPAAEYCRSIVFANGKRGHLPSVGELGLIFPDNNKSITNKINELLDIIGGLKLTITNDYSTYYMSSTLCYDSANTENQLENYFYLRPHRTNGFAVLDNKRTETWSGVLVRPVYSLTTTTDTPNDCPLPGYYIQDVNGSLYKYHEWKKGLSSGVVSNSNANGVLMSDGYQAFVISPSASSDSFIWSSTYAKVPGLEYQVYDPETHEWTGAINDKDGEYNTRMIMKAIEDGIIEDAPAAEYCANYTFPNGKKGYLPSAGELNMMVSTYDGYTPIADLYLELIGGLTMENQYENSTCWWSFWSSTQENCEDWEYCPEYDNCTCKTQAYYYLVGDMAMIAGDKMDNTVLVRPVCAWK